MPHAEDPKVTPIMRGRLVLIAERYGTPRVLVTSAVRSLGYPAKSFSTATDVLAFLSLHPGAVGRAIERGFHPAVSIVEARTGSLEFSPAYAASCNSPGSEGLTASHLRLGGCSFLTRASGSTVTATVCTEKSGYSGAGKQAPSSVSDRFGQLGRNRRPSGTDSGSGESRSSSGVAK